MAAAFRLFQGNPSAFTSADLRLKTWPIDHFKPEEHWMIEKWWSRDERERLGDLVEETFIGAEDLSQRLKDTAAALEELAESLKEAKPSTQIERTKTVFLGDTKLFRMSIGKRVLKKELFYGNGGPIPLFSANVDEGKEHGWVKSSNLKDFSHSSLLWSIDSDFNMTVREAGVQFATTDHCGRLEIIGANLDPSYCRAAITYGFSRAFGFDRVHRPSLQRMRKVTFRVPVNEDGSFDIDAQRSLAGNFNLIWDALRDTEDRMKPLGDLKPKVELPEASEVSEGEAEIEDGESSLGKSKKTPKKIAKGQLGSKQKGSGSETQNQSKAFEHFVKFNLEKIGVGKKTKR